MASTLKHLRSSTADKRPTASGLAEGQLAINTASGTPGVFFKDSNGGVVKVGPAFVGSAAPNAVPAGSAGNSLGELWVDNSLTTPGLNYYTGSAFVNLTPSGTTTTVGLVELATPAETQTGTDAVRAVTPSGLQSKVSDSTSTTSSTTIASSTAVKAAYDLANAALPKAGGTVTGELLIGPTGSLVFEGSSDDTFETTIAVVNPTADRTITFPNVTGTVVTTGDTGSVTSTMILDATITGTDVASGTITSTNIADNTIVNADINSAAGIVYSKLALSSGIVDTDISASAAIAGTKISPDFGSQNVVTTGTITGASFIPSASGVPTNGLYLPAANTVGVATNAVERAKFGTSEVVFNDAGNDYDFRIEGDTNANLFFVDASTDRVGIGTSSPSTPLHVVGSTRFQATTGGAAALFLKSDRATSTAANQGVLQWSDQSDNILAAIQCATVSGNNQGNLHIFTADTSNAGLPSLSSFTFSKEGRLGIGTTSPGTNLDVAGGLNVRGVASAAFTVNASAPNNSLIIDSSGRCLVGTSTARSNLQGASRTAKIQLDSASSDPVTAVDGATISALGGCSGNTGVAGKLTLGRYSSNTLGNTTLVASGDALGYVQFVGADGTNFVPGAAISAQVDGTPGANDMPGRLVFSTCPDNSATPVERLRVTRDGGVGTVSVNAVDGFHIGSTTGAGTATALIRGKHTATSGDPFGTGTASFIVWTNGNVQNTNNSYTIISDAKLKENIIDANSQWDDIKAVKIRNWNFKPETGYETHRQIGPVAQEIEQVCPRLVFETPDRDAEGNDLGTVTKGVNTSVLYMKAVKALQEAMERIEQLETEMAEVKAQLA